MTLVTLLRMISPPFKQGEHVVQVVYATNVVAAFCFAG